MDRRRLWQQLRTLRADPPGLANKGDRRRTFAAALEQAEQLLRSAERLGPETKPLNLFYGLSQGMRAVAAAKIHDSQAWILRGHGITHERSLNRPLSTIKVRDSQEDRGSFRAVAGLLDSPSLPDPTELGDLLAALPLQLPTSTWTDRPHAIEVGHIDQSNGASLVTSPHVYARTRGWTDIAGTNVSAARAAIADHVAEHYPTLTGIEPLPDGHARLHRHETGLEIMIRVSAKTHLGSDSDRRTHLYAKTTEVSGRHFAFPRFGKAANPCHPTVTLWAVLWTLSMLARYEPVRWASTIDVDKSPDATALEEVLADALDLAPWAILDALQ